MRHPLIYTALAAALLQACQSPCLPENFTISQQDAAIYPDYSNVALPCNIAPANFMFTDSSVSGCAARISNSQGSQIIAGGSGNEIHFDEDDWHQLLSNSTNDSLSIELYAMDAQSRWTRYNDLRLYITEHQIDPYISYRLIEPGYSIYGEMSINQRCLENFDESYIYSNKKTPGQCVNCHSYQNYNPNRMLYHKRAVDPGTVIAMDGNKKVVNLKRDFTISAGVYPSWHPQLNLVAFSTNSTHQYFHTENLNKVEVYDTQSDLILYNADTDQVSEIVSGADNLEVFPTWSPCGNYLYYCSAKVLDSTFSGNKLINADKIKYSILRRPFNQQTMQFGNADTVLSQQLRNRSCTLPRISPDGSKIIFAEGAYGCFQIWHHDSNIMMLDLNTGNLDSLSALNSDGYADSYPSFSSNGKWIMIASRRDDGNYSRIYIAYFDGEKVHKPFILPQESASHNIMRMQSYNRPEFMTGMVR